MTDPLRDAIRNLFVTFAQYRVSNDFADCDCCVCPEQSERLAITPLHKLTYGDLERYSRKAMTTWGGVSDFKHFLPRLLELTVEHRDDFLDLAVVFGKIKYAQFEGWAKPERDAVNGFFDQYWRHQLADANGDAQTDSADSVLCAMSNALPSIQRFLEEWIATDTMIARRHLAIFILGNSDALLEEHRLTNPFWDSSGQPHSEVLNWLRSDVVLAYLGNDESNAITKDVAHALPQLAAIRSTLADARDRK